MPDEVKPVETKPAEPEKKEESPASNMEGLEKEKLMAQIQAEYKLAWLHQKPEKDMDMIRLKLFNNQKRDKEAVGDTTMFSIFQTVLASLYDDRLMSIFRGKEDGDEETANNLDALAKADYDDMEKDIIDYDWDWDTLFFGRGLLLVEEYDREPDENVFYPVPEVLDPIMFLRDPSAKSVNGNKKGKGAMRFGGREIKMGKQAMENHPAFFKDINFTELKFGSSTYSLLEDASAARDDAQGNNAVKKDTEADLGANAEYSVTEWFTHTMVNGVVKKVKVWLANDRTIVLGYKLLKRNYWPIVDRPLFPSSHSWRGTSIPDLTEDKQRARAVAQNLGLKAMKADLYPMYLYDTNKVKNKKDLNFDFNKFIGIDASQGESVANSLTPLTKAHPNMGLLQFIYESLDVSAQKATATSDVKMGMQSQQDRPLGETNLVAAAGDTRYSLSAKVFGWSEKRFWRQWYNLYKDNFAEDIDEKILRVVGAFGAKWRPLTRAEIICKVDPDIYIESRAVSRAKDMEDRNTMGNFLVTAITDPSTNRRWALKKMARMNGMEKDEIDRLFPPTIDERLATDENDKLNDNKLTPVLPEDDHNVHLEIHASAKETNASKAHIETHKKALSIKKVNPGIFPPDQGNTDMNAPGGNPPAVTAAPATAPLKPIQPSMTSNQR